MKSYSVHANFSYQCTKLPVTVWVRTLTFLSFVAGLNVMSEIPFLVVEPSQHKKISFYHTIPYIQKTLYAIILKELNTFSQFTETSVE
jgi:hypothetical protein